MSHKNQSEVLNHIYDSNHTIIWVKTTMNSTTMHEWHWHAIKERGREDVPDWDLQIGGSSKRESERCLKARPISIRMSPEEGSVTMISLTGSHRKSSCRDIPSNTFSCPNLRLALTTLSKNTLVSYWARHGWSRCTSNRPDWSKLYDLTLWGKSPAGNPYLWSTLWRSDELSCVAVPVRGRRTITIIIRKTGVEMGTAEDLSVRDIVVTMIEDAAAFGGFKVSVWSLNGTRLWCDCVHAQERTLSKSCQIWVGTEVRDDHNTLSLYYRVTRLVCLVQ